jgi:hypothetical protein
MPNAPLISDAAASLPASAVGEGGRAAMTYAAVNPHTLPDALLQRRPGNRYPTVSNDPVVDDGECASWALGTRTGCHCLFTDSRGSPPAHLPRSERTRSRRSRPDLAPRGICRVRRTLRQRGGCEL